MLSFEVGEASDLARSGEHLLADLRFLEQHAAVLTLWSIAAEKMLKLTIGLVEQDQGRGWPPVEAMRMYRHDVQVLNDRALSAYGERFHDLPSSSTVRLALEAIQQDPVLTMLLSALTCWGQQGRFDRLDHLAGRTPARASAEDLWTGTERLVVALDPSLESKLRSDFEGFRADINTRILESFVRWWGFHVTAWRDGLAGFEAQQHYESLDLAPWD